MTGKPPWARLRVTHFSGKLYVWAGDHRESQPAPDLLRHFQKSRIRFATMDLKIACLAIPYDATLLTRNTVDFAQVSGRRVEIWLD